MIAWENSTIRASYWRQPADRLRYIYTNANTQIQIQIHKYDANTQIQIYTNNCLGKLAYSHFLLITSCSLVSMQCNVLIWGKSVARIVVPSMRYLRIMSEGWAINLIMKQKDQLNCRAAASKNCRREYGKGKRLHQMSIMSPKDCFDDQVQWREGAFGRKNNLNLSEREQKQSANVKSGKSKSLERKWRVLTRLRFPL